MLLGDSNDWVLMRVKRSGHSSGEGSSWLLSLGFSGKGRYATRIVLQKEGAGAAPSSLELGFGGGWSRLLLGGGNSLRLLEPSPVLLLLPSGEPLLVRAAIELGPY